MNKKNKNYLYSILGNLSFCNPSEYPSGIIRQKAEEQNREIAKLKRLAQLHKKYEQEKQKLPIQHSRRAKAVARQALGEGGGRANV